MFTVAACRFLGVICIVSGIERERKRAGGPELFFSEGSQRCVIRKWILLGRLLSQHIGRRRLFYVIGLIKVVLKGDWR